MPNSTAIRIVTVAGSVIIYVICLVGYMDISDTIKKENMVAQQKSKEEQDTTKTEQLAKIQILKESIPVTKIETTTYDMQQSIGNQRSEEYVYGEMHQMINSKIVAVDNKISGEIDITPEACLKLITEIRSSCYDDKELLITFLKRWRKGIFKDGVEEHNYLWNKLDGVIGQAVALRNVVK